MAELNVEDTSSFKNFVGMEPAMFHELLERVSLIHGTGKVYDMMPELSMYLINWL